MNINLTLIGQTISFALFVWFVMKFVWPPVIAALEERRRKIGDGLAAAERGRREYAIAEHRVGEIVGEAKGRAAGIIDQASRRAADVVDEAKVKAKGEAGRILESAEAEIAQQRNSAREALRAQVAALAVAGAERILAREVNATDHDALLKELAAQL